MLSRNLRVAMAMKGLRSKQLAKAVGVTPVTVSGWLNGRSEPSLARLRTIAMVLDTDATKLIGGL